ncbi:hypothetical protein [Streptomyces meridianus]|uniref:Uncharacterized protein n=1 Tax=Streptomyces meridianus TaxID=2938945 RepID=A0ABT0X653_9ACTN|nr:hypothetical protein [Streptomyces meridianus]MCM2578017.1 hypothetical protein [Streptomyces meridianus]
MEHVQAVITLPEGPWWDWDVVAWERGRLRLGAGYDLTYHHGLELVFGDVLFVSCPDSFQEPRFRAPTPDELRTVDRYCGHAPVVVAFDAESDGPDPLPCLIAAHSVDIVQGIVLRYWRDDAAPGRRFAPWVRRPE